MTHYSLVPRFINNMVLKLSSNRKKKILLCTSLRTLTISFVFQSPCSSSPCKNGGTCRGNYESDTFECDCEKGFIGKYCETGESCSLKGTKSRFVHLEQFSLNFSSLQSLSIFAILNHPCSLLVYSCLFKGFLPINNNFQRPKKQLKIS